MRLYRRPLTRRRFIEGTALAACGLAVGRAAIGSSEPAPLVLKTIPASGERVPVVGLGTNNYSVESSEELAQRRAVLERLVASGCRVVDTAPAYGRSEIVIGQLIAELGIRDDVFLATKVTTTDTDGGEGKAMLEQSFERLRTDRIDLIQVHNLLGADVLLPIVAEMKEAGRVRYIGITTSRQDQHATMLDLMRRHVLDFIQVNYSIEDDAAAERILPFAAEKGVAVLINMPFGGRRGGNLFGKVQGRELPAWAGDIGAKTWAQFLLNYVVSHPAVTCAIPGTHRPEHAADNFAVARGTLADAEMRERMASYWRGL